MSIAYLKGILPNRCIGLLLGLSIFVIPTAPALPADQPADQFPRAPTVSIESARGSKRASWKGWTMIPRPSA